MTASDFEWVGFDQGSICLDSPCDSWLFSQVFTMECVYYYYFFLNGKRDGKQNPSTILTVSICCDPNYERSCCITHTAGGILMYNKTWICKLAELGDLAK